MRASPLPGQRPQRPATAANVARNELERAGQRRERWGTARDSAWALLERHLPAGATVAVVGAGNGDDIPLRRIADRAGELDLYDLDGRALERALRVIPVTARRRTRIIACDVTAGAADRLAIAARARLGRRASGSLGPAPSPGPLGVGGYDLVIGDLLYTQLLYPALRDSRLPPRRIERALARDGPALTEAVVRRMNASVATGGLVIHLHDAVGWWPGRAQPVSLADILALGDVAGQLALAAACRRPTGADPRAAVRRLGVPILETRFWEWPFTRDARYLVCATVTAPAVAVGTR